MTIQIIDGKFYQDGLPMRPEIGNREQTRLLDLWRRAQLMPKRRLGCIGLMQCPWCMNAERYIVTEGNKHLCPSCGQAYHWSRRPGGWYEILPFGITQNCPALRRKRPQPGLDMAASMSGIDPQSGEALDGKALNGAGNAQTMETR